MSLSPLYALLGEVSVQVFCPFFNWVVCLPGVESCDFTPGRQAIQLKKWAKDLNRLLQGGHTEGPETYERMLSVTTYQRDANLNHSEILLHTGQNGHYKQINKQQVLARLWRKGNPSALLVGMQTSADTVENSVEFPQKTKNGNAFCLTDSTAGIMP